ncbi:unnamed protein product [Nesidiocoris tenuis]|uniref:Uncharacterized protein n=1 Tax=Nesidiocoris tenuis TaxID=355587 RepID=A0A6H5H3B3_9HEMI|nr:unnamed protein product [Nesidiocoris tenuis]
MISRCSFPGSMDNAEIFSRHFILLHRDRKKSGVSELQLRSFDVINKLDQQLEPGGHRSEVETLGLGPGGDLYQSDGNHRVVYPDGSSKLGMPSSPVIAITASEEREKFFDPSSRISSFRLLNSVFFIFQMFAVATHTISDVGALPKIQSPLSQAVITGWHSQGQLLSGLIHGGSKASATWHWIYIIYRNVACSRARGCSIFPIRVGRCQVLPRRTFQFKKFEKKWWFGTIILHSHQSRNRHEKTKQCLYFSLVKYSVAVPTVFEVEKKIAHLNYVQVHGRNLFQQRPYIESEVNVHLVCSTRFLTDRSDFSQTDHDLSTNQRSFAPTGGPGPPWAPGPGDFAPPAPPSGRPCLFELPITKINVREHVGKVRSSQNQLTNSTHKPERQTQSKLSPLKLNSQIQLQLNLNFQTETHSRADIRSRTDTQTEIQT